MRYKHRGVPRACGWRISSVAIAALFVLACEAPQVIVESEPAQADLHRDGVSVGQTPARFPAPYFGQVLVELEVPTGDAPGSPVYEPATALVEVEQPGLGLIFPFEIFPLNFVTETIARIGGLEPTRAKLTLPKQPRSAAPPDDAELDKIIEAFERAAVRR